MKTTEKYGEKIDLALSTWVKLARASATLNRHSAENIRSFGLTPPQFGVIESLGHLGPMKVGGLCEKMLVTGGNMTLVLDNLEKQGLVERVPSPEDRRAINVQLSTKGRDLFDKIFITHAEYITEMISVLNAEEQSKLSELLKKLGTGVKQKG